MLNDIIDNRILYNAVSKPEGNQITCTGLWRNKRTTKGCKICVLWKYRSNDRIVINYLKESYMVELAEYAVANSIQDGISFILWVTHAYNKYELVLHKVKYKYCDRTRNYLVIVPESIDYTNRIDDDNGNTLRMYPVKLEMKNVMVYFEE